METVLETGLEQQANQSASPLYEWLRVLIQEKSSHDHTYLSGLDIFRCIHNLFTSLPSECSNLEQMFISFNPDDITDFQLEVNDKDFNMISVIENYIDELIKTTSHTLKVKDYIKQIRKSMPKDQYRKSVKLIYDRIMSELKQIQSMIDDESIEIGSIDSLKQVYLVFDEEDSSEFQIRFIKFAINQSRSRRFFPFELEELIQKIDKKFDKLHHHNGVSQQDHTSHHKENKKEPTESKDIKESKQSKKSKESNKKNPSIDIMIESLPYYVPNEADLQKIDFSKLQKERDTQKSHKNILLDEDEEQHESSTEESVLNNQEINKDEQDTKQVKDTTLLDFDMQERKKPIDYNNIKIKKSKSNNKYGQKRLIKNYKNEDDDELSSW